MTFGQKSKPYCTFSERDRSQRYTQVYFNTQHCYDVMSFVCSYASPLPIFYRPGICTNDSYGGIIPMESLLIYLVC